MIGHRELFRAPRCVALAASLAAGIAGSAAMADVVRDVPVAVPDLVADWSQAQVVTYDDLGLALYFAFYPAAPQDGIDPTQIELLDPIVRQSIGVDSSLFQEIPEEEELQTRPVFTLLLGAVRPGEDPPVWGGPTPDPVPDEFQRLSYGLDIGGETLTARLGLFSEPDDGPGGGINPASIVVERGFNPQPEPPALLGDGDAFGFDFTYTGFSTAVVELTLIDPDGQPISPTRVAPLTPVPLPAAGMLLAGGLAALSVLRRRRDA